MNQLINDEHFFKTFRPFYRDLQMTNMSVEQNLTISIRPEDTITIDAVVESNRGRGSGSLTTSFRHILADRSWFRVMRIVSLINFVKKEFSI